MNKTVQPPPRGPRLCLCIPAFDRVHTDFMISAWGVGRTYVGPLGILVHQSSIIANSRCALVDQARNLKMEWILFLDSDMTFPADTPQRLLAHNKKIVGCAYRRRGPPFDIHAETLFNAPHEGLTPMKKLGLGVMLVHMSVFDNLKRPYFRSPSDEELELNHGEDFDFCARAQVAGYNIFCDWDLSQEVQHLWQFPLELRNIGIEEVGKKMIELANARATV